MSKEDAKVAKWEDKLQLKADKGDSVAIYTLLEHYMSDKSYHEENFIPLLQQARSRFKCDACEANILARRCGERKYSAYPGHILLDRMLDASGLCPEGSYRMADYHNDRYNYDSAIYYAHRAALAGHVESMYRLATYYEQFDIMNKQGNGGPNKSKYTFWYKQAADKGHQSAREIYDVIVKAADSSYARGLKAYQAKDYTTALYWFEICARGNNDANAYFFAGVIHHTGLAGKTDISDARRSYEFAGKLGLADGYYFAAGIWWMEGFGGPAMEDYQKAADMGYAGAAGEKIKIQQNLAAAASERERSSAEYYAKQKAAKLPTFSYDFSKDNPANKKRTSTCSSCGGSGTIHTTVYGGMKGPGNSVSFGEYRTCTACGGSGH